LSDALVTVERLGVPRILEDVSLEVRRGRVHVLVGPNGGGKSTLVGAILGLVEHDGRVETKATRIGYVPQRFAVDRTIPVTVADFLALTRQRRPVCLGISPAAKRSIASLLDRVGLAGMEKKPLWALSGGELQRTLLANAIDPKPELLVLDEPGAGLDAASAARLEEIVLGARKDGVTVLMVSHDLAQARRLGDRVTVLDRRVVRDGTPSEALA
jgi:zinc transport system ATP-binding protein